jgi:hypothetical protein
MCVANAKRLRKKLELLWRIQDMCVVCWYSLVKKAIKICLIVLFPIVVIVLFEVFKHPVGFQKTNSISEVNELPLVQPSVNALEVNNFIGGIPYKDGKLIFDILPSNKFIKTIIEGYGNCSNLSFGAAYFLRQNGIGYQIVHFLPFQSYFDGEGHTVINTVYNYQQHSHVVGIVDVIEGGLPQTENNRNLTINDLVVKDSWKPIHILSFNKIKDNKSEYYNQKYLKNIVIGVMTDAEIARYFRFIEYIYVPLGSAKLEKYLYDGLALFFGAYPSIYVTQYSALGQPLFDRVFYKSALWLIRGYVVLLIFWFILAFLPKGRLLRARS